MLVVIGKSNYRLTVSGSTGAHFAMNLPRREIPAFSPATEQEPEM